MLADLQYILAKVSADNERTLRLMVWRIRRPEARRLRQIISIDLREVKDS